MKLNCNENETLAEILRAIRSGQGRILATSVLLDATDNFDRILKLEGDLAMIRSEVAMLQGAVRTRGSLNDA